MSAKYACAEARSSLKLYTVLVLVVVSCGPGARAPPMDDSSFQHDSNASTANSACGECHEAEFREYGTSAHARGLASEAFRDEWLPDPLSFCSSCHAPLGAPGSAEAHDAVGCVSCHQRSASGDFERVTDQECAACHEFHFPSPSEAPTSPYSAQLLLQSTVTEWRMARERIGDQGCIDCHMSDHAMTLGNVEVLNVEMGWTREDVLELRLRATDAVGHSLPTGDVFRGLLLEAVNSAGEVVAHRTLRRRFVGARDTQGVLRMEERADGRVPPPGQGERVVHLRGVDAAATLRIWVERRAGSITSQAAGVEDVNSPAPRRRIWTGSPPPRI